MVFKLRSPAIAPSGHIPAKYTCDGSDLSPPLRWTEPPRDTTSFALIVHDHDASGGGNGSLAPLRSRGLAAGAARGGPHSGHRREHRDSGDQRLREGRIRRPVPGPWAEPSLHFFRLYSLDAPLCYHLGRPRWTSCWPGQFPASFMGDDLASPPR